MNSVQFGRWLSERRRACGWPSQRLLSEAAQQHTILHSSGISEDFLSRLEAGHLAHPFRGTVRRRILQLAWLFCKTPRDLRAYLKAAGLGDFSDEESTQLRLLSEHLAALQTPPPLLLPPRPQRLKGREQAVEQILHTLNEPETQVFSVTGMPGVGKSAVVYEALHCLASAESDRLRRFSDGIATFTCTGRQGTRGLISLLTEITALFTSTDQNGQGSSPKRSPHKRQQPNMGQIPFEQGEDETELASAIDRARAALAKKRVLLLLDDLEPTFPLRQALDVLLAQSAPTSHEQKTEHVHEQRVIVITSQFIPAPALVAERLHLRPLTEQAALELLTELVGEELSERDLIYARQACAAIGYLPLAIESMATAILTKGIPMALVATHLAVHPLEGLLDGEEDVIAKLERALTVLDEGMREQYMLLATLGIPVFDLESAAAVTAPYKLPLPNGELVKSTETRQADPVALVQRASRDFNPEPFALNRQNKRAIWEMAYGEHMPDLAGDAPAEEEKERMARLASTAALLGQFVRYSLLELLPAEQGIANGTGITDPKHSAQGITRGMSLPTSPGNEIGYQMHALLHIYARDVAQTLPADRLELARHNLLSYALTYVTRYGEHIPHMERAAGRGVVLAGLELAWNAKRYEIVIRLAQGLIPLSGRLEGDQGASILQKGLYASQQLQNQPAIISFLDRLATLRCYHGELLAARQMWEAALHIQESMDDPPGCLHPLVGLAHLAYIQGDSQAARRFSDAYVQQAELSGNYELIIKAHATRAFYARILGQKDLAHGDLLTSLRLMHELEFAPALEHKKELVEMEARIELARVEEDYPRAQAYAEATIALIRELYDQYNVVDILYGQACFALQQGLSEDARDLARRAAQAAMEAGAPHFYKNSMRLLQEI